MDIIDNLLYATVNSPLQPPPAKIISKFISPFTTLSGPINKGEGDAPVFEYPLDQKINLCSYQDPEVLETAIQRHWYDVNAKFNYDTSGPNTSATPAGTDQRFTSFAKSSTYHLIFSYLVANTRILQIFERMIEKYMQDEEFGIAENRQAFNWIINSDYLFFKGDSFRTPNSKSPTRLNGEPSFRNAWWRMFAMDLAFGDINNTTAQYPYPKAKTSNQQFVPLFEKYLSEIWQTYINANNSSGVNTADMNSVIDLATQLRELLVARRGNFTTSSYADMNLSREEFSSVLATSWFMMMISDNTPIVQFLKCESSTMGERLIKIGNRVGIPAHTKCQTLFEMAGAAANILRTVEQGQILDNPAVMPSIITSLLPGTIGASQKNKNYMSDFLTVINNWEKATGHKIKNPEGNISGVVRVAQNGVKAQPVMN